MDLSPAHNQSLEDLDRENIFHPFTLPSEHMAHGPKIMVKGQGVRLTDNHGTVYLDGLAGLWCVNAGYGRQEIVDAIAKQAALLPYYHSFASMGTEPGVYTADTVRRMVPGNMARVLFGCSGSDANDTQVKLAWYYNNLKGRPQKKKIIARDRAYHGVTVASGSLTGLPTVHKAFDLPLPQVVRVRCPHFYREAEAGESEEAFADRLAAELEATIEAEGADTIAAFIAEPVMGAGGVIVPPKGYFEKVQKILKANDILFIADEVICGFGRLGTPFGSDYFGIVPDMISVAKGITSGYQPLSAVIVCEEVWSTILESSDYLGTFGHGYTYTNHPIACAAANANIELMEREKLFDNAATAGAHFHAALHSRLGDHPAVGEIRGVGLMGAVELVADRATKRSFEPAAGIAKKVQADALARGLILRPMMNDSLAFSPPLCLTTTEADEIVDILAASIEANMGAMKDAGANH
ncbi:aminotransferase [Acuticoccus mangrovi]|uniref:Aminotransferase class III-fold pyridoxal phosphate-dependent enzyme n=1 Tax=Acuticoccus mangrovi TaxID=2796142 RepID=A0A934IP36_9HYPH|nr:aminotransferase [Acuticoccus mangrovi]MBJ3774984.1 aminotransferase class III-fold pyridoxal phosphate-dependent enzyme [Acuticoccus mangrovi]